jgi:hypothetical protein
MTTKLAWHRKDITPGVKASGDQHRYIVSPAGRGAWTLEIWTTKKVAGCDVADRCVETTDYHSTQRLAKDVAAAYEALGNDYRPVDHGHRGRMTEATIRAYDAARR